MLLTTHSMEEADALSDRIGILSAGQFVALGSSLHLKTRFGEGYRVSLIAPPHAAVAVRRAAKAIIGRDPSDEAAGATVFSLSDKASVATAPRLFEFIEEVQAGKREGLELTDWGLSHTTLEDVFVALAQGDAQPLGGAKRRQKRNMFKATLPLNECDWAPGRPFTYVARDGIEYHVGVEQLPTAKQWRRLGLAKGGIYSHEVKLERKQRNLARLLDAVPGTRLVRIFKASFDDPVGLSLCGAPTEPPLVCGIEAGSLAAKTKRVFVGDEVVAINGARSALMASSIHGVLTPIRPLHLDLTCLGTPAWAQVPARLAMRPPSAASPPGWASSTCTCTALAKRPPLCVRLRVDQTSWLPCSTALVGCFGASARSLRRRCSCRSCASWPSPSPSTRSAHPRCVAPRLELPSSTNATAHTARPSCLLSSASPRLSDHRSTPPNCGAHCCIARPPRTPSRLIGPCGAGLHQGNVRERLEALRVNARYGCSNVTTILARSCRERKPTTEVGTATYPACPVRTLDDDSPVVVQGRSLQYGADWDGGLLSSLCQPTLPGNSYNYGYDYEGITARRRMQDFYAGPTALDAQAAINRPGCFICAVGIDTACDVDEPEDQCTTSVLGGANPDFHLRCGGGWNGWNVSDAPYCNCSSSAFDALASGTRLCRTALQANRQLYEDLPPVKLPFSSPRSVSSAHSDVPSAMALGAAADGWPAGMPSDDRYAFRFVEDGVERLFRDSWDALLGWIVPVVYTSAHAADQARRPGAPSAVPANHSANLSANLSTQLGAMVNVASVSGFLELAPRLPGSFATADGHAYNTTAAWERMQISGLLAGLPHGIGLLAKPSRSDAAAFAVPVYDVQPAEEAIISAVLASQISTRNRDAATSQPLPAVNLGGSEPPPLTLEQVFPSAVVGVSELDASAFRSRISITSFWGKAADWPFIQPPPGWPERAAGGARFQIAKFASGLLGERWERAGGMGAVLPHWWADTHAHADARAARA